MRAALVNERPLDGSLRQTVAVVEFRTDSAGFDLDLFEARTGLHRDTIGATLEQAVARGWLLRDAGHVVPTEFGRRFLNDVMSAFL